MDRLYDLLIERGRHLRANRRRAANDLGGIVGLELCVARVNTFR